MNEAMLQIGGRRVAAAKTFDRINPATGAVASRAAAATPEEACAAADAAAAALPDWSAFSPSARRACLSRAADALEVESGTFVALMMAEVGATPPWAQFNTALAASMLREAAAMTTQIKGEIIPSDKPGSLSMAFRRPAGVVLGIAPWNAPVILGVRAIAMPLACGNTVVLKSSEISPATHEMIGRIFDAAGCPPGAVNVVSNAPDDAAAVVEALIAHRAVRRVNFTGSTRVGRRIAALAAHHLKPALLELGGKAALIVLRDADIAAAVNAAAFGAFLNQGQICMSTERVLVEDEIAERYVAMLSEKAASLPVGKPNDAVVLGPMISPGAAAHVRELIDDAVRLGATIACGGPGDGNFVPATVLDHVTSEMRVYREESFGPLVCIVRVQTAAEAVRVANDSEYGLSSAIFSRDVSAALHIAAMLETGICHINGPTVHDEAQMPFGGTKGSGYGRFGGQAAVAEFTELQWVTIEDPRQHYPF